VIGVVGTRAQNKTIHPHAMPGLRMKVSVPRFEILAMAAGNQNNHRVSQPTSPIGGLAAEEDQNDTCEDEINALFEFLTTEPTISRQPDGATVGGSGARL
jgi:hypothetical protein